MKYCEFCSKRFLTDDARYKHQMTEHVNLSNPQVQYMIKTKQLQLAPKRRKTPGPPLLKRQTAYINEGFDQSGGRRRRPKKHRGIKKKNKGQRKRKRTKRYRVFA